jgi:hypothetical protein
MNFSEPCISENNNPLMEHPSSDSKQPSKSKLHSLLRTLGIKIAGLVLAGIVFGWGYSWAEPRCYKTEQPAGFWLGTLHGALMPTALPCLLMGRDVPIFTANNTGRTYKMGYIAGINFCGLVFFGLSFYRPSRTEGPKS